MYSIRLEGETAALLRKMRRYSEIDRRSLNMALGEGVRESTLERFKEGRAPDGRRWKTSIRAATTGEDPHRLLAAPQLDPSDGGRFGVRGRHERKARSDTPIWRPGAHHPGPEGEEPPLPGGRPVGQQEAGQSQHPRPPVSRPIGRGHAGDQGDDRGVHREG